MWRSTNSNARSPIGLQSCCPDVRADRKWTPPQRRLDWQSSSNSVNVAQGPSVISVAGVTPGSITDEPAGTVTDQPNASEPRYRRLACECAAQKHADPDGYSGWFPVGR